MPRALHYLRAPATSSDAALRIDRENRLIRGVSVATAGEIMGHDGWFDVTSLEQIVKLANGRKKLRSRFTHPGLSSDGMGKQIGTLSAFTIDGNRVRGDQQLYRKVSNPQRLGMIQDVLDLAEEDPEALAISIVLARDLKAEETFLSEHSVKEGDAKVFMSPDPANTQNLPHWRLADVTHADVVNKGAANNEFLSDGEELASRFESVMSWAFDLTEVAPDALALGGFPAEKVRDHVRSFLARHNLQVVQLDAAGYPAVELGMVTCPDCGAEFDPDAKTVPDAKDKNEPVEPNEIIKPKTGCSVEGDPAVVVEDPTEAIDAGTPVAETPVTETSVELPVLIEPLAVEPIVVTETVATEVLGAISYDEAHPHGCAVLPEGTPWNGPEEVAAATVEDLPKMCAWRKTRPANQLARKGDFKLPHHAHNNGHSLNPKGLYAAAGRFDQTDMPVEDKAVSRAHLAEHYHDMDQKAPWERNNASNWDLYEQLCLTRLSDPRGPMNDAERAATLRVLGFSIEASACGEYVEESPHVDGTKISIPDGMLERVVSGRMDAALGALTGKLVG